MKIKRIARYRRKKARRKKIIILAILLCVVLSSHMFLQRQTAAENKQPQRLNSSVENNTVDEQLIVMVKTEKGELIKQDLEEYVACVVAAEMPAKFELEALKAQAVAARSYGVYYLQNNDYIPAGTTAQAWIDENEQQNRWGDNYAEYSAKIAQAVAETTGEVLLWQEEVIEAVYHASCGGKKTAAAQEVWGGYVPYLPSINCEHGVDKHTATKYVFTKKELADKLKIKNVDKIQITSITDSGRVEEVKVGNDLFQGTQLRSLLGLSSTVFTIESKDGKAIITSNGAGHGVGLCQYGAQYWAQKGMSYAEILAHFYPQTQIGQV